MPHGSNLSVTIFGGPKLSMADRGAVNISPRMAVLLGLVTLSRPSGLLISSALDYLWREGTDRALQKRLDELLRSFAVRTAMPCPVVRDGSSLVLDEHQCGSDYAAWEDALARGDIQTAAAMWRPGLFVLHRAELTASGDAFVLTMERKCKERLGLHGSRWLDEALLRGDWTAAVEVSRTLHALFPRRIRYLATLINALTCSGRRHEAEAQVDRAIASDVITRETARQLLNLNPDGRHHLPPASSESDLLSQSKCLAYDSGSVVMPGRLLGRDRELSCLYQFLSAPHPHNWRIHFLTGRSGVGRTTLLRSAYFYSQTISYRALFVSLLPATRSGGSWESRSSKVDVAPMHPAAQDLTPQVELQRLLAAGAPIRPDETKRVAETLRTLAERRPLLLCLDDAPDIPALVARLNLLRRAVDWGDSVVRVVVTVRGLYKDLSMLCSDPHEHTIVSDFSLEDRQAFLRGRLGSAPSPLRLEELQAQNLAAPLFLAALADTAAPDWSASPDSPDTELALPPWFLGYIDTLTSTLSQDTRRILHVLACAEHPVSVQDIESLTGQCCNTVIASLHVLYEINVSFEHAGHFAIPWTRLRRHISSRIPNAERADTYLRLASSIASTNPFPRQTPSPLILASAEYQLELNDLHRCQEILRGYNVVPGSLKEINRLLRLISTVETRADHMDPQLRTQAASIFMKLGLGDQAQYWFSRASREFRLRGQARDDYRCRLLALRAMGMEAGTDLSQVHDQASAVFTTALKRGWWDIIKDSVDLRVRLYDHSFDLEGMAGVLDEVKTRVGDLDEWSTSRSSRASLHALIFLCEVYVRPNTAWHMIRSVLEPYMVNGSDPIPRSVRELCHAGILMLGKHDTVEGDDLLRVVGPPLAAEDEHEGGDLFRMNQAVLLMNSWEYDSAISELRRLLPPHDIAGISPQHGLVHANLSIAHARSRQWLEALAHLRDGMALFGARPPGAVRSAAAAVTGLEALERGEFTTAQKSLEALDRIPAGCPYDPILPTLLRGRWAWQHGRRDEALSVFRTAFEDETVHTHDTIHLMYQKARLLRRMGRHTEAENILRQCADQAIRAGLTHAYRRVRAYLTTTYGMDIRNT